MKKARGERVDAHLRIVHRKQECGALLHESWDSDWQQRWALGPSRPPPDRPAYRSLDARDATHPDALSLQGDLEAMGLTPVRGDEGQPRSLKLHPGCRARITAVDANMIKQLSALGRLGPLLQPGPPPRLAHDVSRYVGAEVLVVREFVAAVAHLLQRAKVWTVRLIKDARGETFEGRRSNSRRPRPH